MILITTGPEHFKCSAVNLDSSGDFWYSVWIFPPLPSGVTGAIYSVLTISKLLFLGLTVVSNREKNR